MIKYKTIIILISFVLLSGCGILKEGLQSPKQKTTDEFLVEKKSPLVMPPNFNELPVPNSNDQKIQKDQKNIEDLITKSDTNKNKNKKKTNKSLENLILEEIKK
ncbi:DUF3035 domain-containing protein [Candidatus Pelagibacter sp.]|jgi:hypothetical protein|nr:DUF3035 domain-containing protein [Candidatus Pelagibacter sp.]